MSGNNPYGNQPGQPNQGPPNQPNQGPGYQGPPGQGQPGGYPQPGPSYPGPQYGQPQQPYSQPTPSGPYPPQGPAGPQGLGGPPGPGGPQQPYGGYPPGPPQKPAKSNKLPLIIGAGVLALVLIGTAVGIAVVRGGGDEPTAGGGAGGGGTSAPVEAKLPSDAVRGYLEALAAGDAQAALGYASTAPSDTTFLTNDVLAASLETGAITAINVPEVTDEYAYSVAASYQIGNQAINADFPVEETGGAWKLREVAYDLTLSSAQNKTLPMLINGVQVEAEKVAVFPGTYTFTTGLDTISYGKNNRLVVQSVSDYPEGMSDIQPTLTSAGEKAFTKAVKASLDKCMDSKKIKNANCPNTFDRISGAQPDNGTLKWKYDKDALDNMKIRLDYANPAIAESNVSLSITATAECDGSPCKLTSFGNPDPSANMTKDPLKIIWSN